MVKRPRRDPEPGEFQDPLSNYDPREYADELERSLCEDDMSVFKTTPIATISPSATVHEALTMMDELGVACLMIVVDRHLLGVLSERDVLNRFTDDYDKIKDRPVSECMTVEPSCVHETGNPAQALNLMAVGSFRHVPILNAAEHLVGVLGPRRVTKYIQKHFDTHAEE